MPVSSKRAALREIFRSYPESDLESPRTLSTLTPIEEHGGYLVKRDDLANERGVRGGKARTLGVICRYIQATGKRGLTMHAARNSVTPATLGAVCYAYGIQATCHTAAAKDPLPAPYMDAIRHNVRVIEHRPGYMSVLAARARDQATTDGYLLVGLGLDYHPATLETAKQVANLPPTKRLVTSVGSGHMLEGIIKGLEDKGPPHPSILGICVGKIPDCLINLSTALDVELVESKTPFNRPASTHKLGDLDLNPYYESKCLEYLQPGDLFWIVAK